MEWIKIHYLDASALVKILIKEEGSEIVQQYFGNESNFHTTSLCFAETLGVLKAKYLYRNEIREEEYWTACDELMAFAAYENIEIEDVNMSDRTLFTEVENLARQHRRNLDVSDAFQIVTIKYDFFSKFSETKPLLITADSNLADVARQEGLKVWYCVNEPPPL
jgi:predicted nucleic acid-binding protein